MELMLMAVFSLAVAFLADKRGRRGILWFFISLFISPIISVIFLFCMKDLSKEY